MQLWSVSPEGVDQHTSSLYSLTFPQHSKKGLEATEVGHTPPIVGDGGDHTPATEVYHTPPIASVDGSPPSVPCSTGLVAKAGSLAFVVD